MEFPGDFLSTIIEEMRVTCKASEILESGHGIVVLNPSVRSHAETFWMISAGYGWKLRV